MAQFKVGDRVRIRKDAVLSHTDMEWVRGLETVIIGVGGRLEWKLLLAGAYDNFEAKSSALEPILLDPLEVFMESLETLGDTLPLKEVALES